MENFRGMRTRSFLWILAFPAFAAAATAREGVPSTPAAAELAARWQRATAARPAEGPVLHVVSRSTEDGIPGTIDEWISQTGNYRRVAQREFDESEIVATAREASRRDWNGFVREVEGRELARLRAQIAEAAAIAFGPPPDAVSSPSSGTAPMLRFAPPGAESVEFRLDAGTGLPLESDRPGDDTAITTTWEDWTELAGRRVPGRSRVAETDKPEYTISRVRAAWEGPPGGFARPASGPSDVRHAAAIPPIPFTLESNHIVFPVSVNGRPPIGFILDTGADQEVIHSARLSAFGLDPYAKSATTGGGNSAEYDYAKDATLSLPGVELVHQHVAAIEQTGLERALGVPLGGLLGFDFISRFVVEIDYEKMLVTLHDPASWTYAGKGAVVPLVFDGGIPFMRGTISAGPEKNVPALFVLDFGAAETMTLTSPFVKAHRLDALARNPTVNRPAGLEKQFFAQNNVRGRVDRLTIGDLTVDAIPVNLSVNTSGAYASESFAGTVGETIYCRYHVYLDYARKRAIFEPTAAASLPFPERRTYGLTLLASGPDLHTYTVSAVRPGSPAEQNAFRKGDVIAAWDGEPAGRFTLSELRDRLAREGEKHTLTILRGSESLDIPVTIRLVSIEKA
jgi:hypothetical protein